jgi:hypothetical protein
LDGAIVDALDGDEMTGREGKADAAEMLTKSNVEHPALVTVHLYVLTPTGIELTVDVAEDRLAMVPPPAETDQTPPVEAVAARVAVVAVQVKL